MSTYKVIQDIEAEDKLLGPLTLRQFIYATVVIVLGFISFKLAPVSPVLIVPLLPPMIFFGMLAAPFGHDQSSEVWLLAKIRFMLKPRRRIWDQSGMLELVTITVPKKIEKHLTDGLSQTEVKSRLHALANTIDSRGWAVKNVNVNLFSQPTYLNNYTHTSDRLIDSSSLPQDVPAFEVTAADDILDERNNPTAQHLDTMINQAEQAHRQSAVAAAQGSGGQQSQAPQDDYWFMNQPDPALTPPGYATFSQSQTVLPGTTPATIPQDTGAAEEALLEQIHKDKARPNPAYGHMRVVDPHGSKTRDTGQNKKHKPKSSADKHQPPAEATKPVDPALLSLAARDDLNVSTIAREAERNNKKPPDDEVVISLR
ncbi:MAG: PrgI family protein [Patescibacteria group bacterium]